MAYRSYLTPSQYEAIRQIFTEIYDSLSRAEKGELCRHIGLASANAWHVKQGINTLPMVSVKAMYQRTGNDIFRLTPEQKESYRRHTRLSRKMPDDEGWPDISPADLQKVLEKREEDLKYQKDRELVSDLKGSLAEFARGLKYLSKLEANNPVRKEAQRTLLVPAMNLFTEVTMLGMDFPEAFNDLREQLELASTLFGEKGKRK